MELRRRSKLADGFAAIRANLPVLLVVFAFNGALVGLAYILRSKRPPVPKVDVVFVFDTTSSMSGEIRGMVRAARDFAAELATTGSDFRVGAVTFGDEIREAQPMTDDVGAVRRFFGGLDADGGGDTPEDLLLAGMAAIESMEWRRDAKPYMVFITDAPFHRTSRLGHTFDQLRQAASARGVTVYVAAIPEVSEYTSWPAETGGKFYDIHATSRFDMVVVSIGKSIAGSLSQ
ncbi:MAG: VWA domain-containing protein [Armatimonadota bacterium]